MGALGLRLMSQTGCARPGTRCWTYSRLTCCGWRRGNRMT